MPGNFDRYKDEIRASREKAKRTRAERAEVAVSQEQRALDLQYEFETQQQAAIADRAETLAVARDVSVAMQGFMRINKTSPELQEIFREPVLVERGVFKKRLVPSGKTREQIALEGWSALNWATISDHDYARSRYQLVLTPAVNSNLHPPLVWFETPDSYYKDGQYVTPPITRADVHPLSATPLAHDDMPWPAPKNAGIVRIDGREYDFRYSSSSGSPKGSIRTEPDPAVEPEKRSFLDRADYELYRKAKIEQKIRTALFDIAARYEVDL